MATPQASQSLDIDFIRSQFSETTADALLYSHDLHLQWEQICGGDNNKDDQFDQPIDREKYKDENACPCQCGGPLRHCRLEQWRSSDWLDAGDTSHKRKLEFDPEDTEKPSKRRRQDALERAWDMIELAEPRPRLPTWAQNDPIISRITGPEMTFSRKLLRRDSTLSQISNVSTTPPSSPPSVIRILADDIPKALAVSAKPTLKLLSIPEQAQSATFEPKQTVLDKKEPPSSNADKVALPASDAKPLNKSQGPPATSKKPPKPNPLKRKREAPISPNKRCCRTPLPSIHTMETRSQTTRSRTVYKLRIYTSYITQPNPKGRRSLAASVGGLRKPNYGQDTLRRKLSQFSGGRIQRPQREWARGLSWS